MLSFAAYTFWRWCMVYECAGGTQSLIWNLTWKSCCAHHPSALCDKSRLTYQPARRGTGHTHSRWVSIPKHFGVYSPPLDWHTVHIDGSAIVGTLNGGAGIAVAERGPPKPTTLLTKQQRGASSYKEENMVTCKALERLLQSHEAVNICTNSQSFLKAIQSGSSVKAHARQTSGKDHPTCDPMPSRDCW